MSCEVIVFWVCLQLIAVFDEQEPLHKIESPGGNPAGRQSPDAFETEVAAQLAAFKPIGGEIEVTPSALKIGMFFFVVCFSSGASP